MLQALIPSSKNCSNNNSNSEAPPMDGDFPDLAPVQVRIAAGEALRRGARATLARGIRAPPRPPITCLLPVIPRPSFSRALHFQNRRRAPRGRSTPLPPSSPGLAGSRHPRSLPVRRAKFKLPLLGPLLQHSGFLAVVAFI